MLVMKRRLQIVSGVIRIVVGLGLAAYAIPPGSMIGLLAIVVGLASAVSGVLALRLRGEPKL